MMSSSFKLFTRLNRQKNKPVIIHLYRYSTSTHSKSCEYRRMFSKSDYQNYDDFYSSFKWNIPTHFNIGYECSDYHVDSGNGDKIALIDHTANTEFTFNEMSILSNKLCNALSNELGVGIGDRISILLPQCIETSIAHIAAFKLGAISLPLFILFGAEALLFRLSNSESKILITNNECLPLILSLRTKLPHLKHVIVTGQNVQNCADYIISFESLICAQSEKYECAHTFADDPAVIIYTSGTTGSPKGCLHAHRVLLGHLPGIETPHNFLPQTNDIFWTPADWAWIGGLFDALLPSLYYGIPIVAHRAKKFNVFEAFEIMKKYKVTSTFLPPTALKMMKMISEQNVNQNNDAYKHKLRSIGSGGESLGDALHEWALQTFGTEINEFYGQTECNLIVSNAFKVFKSKPRSMGKAVPGHIVKIIDNDGNECKNNQIGNICVKYPDPVCFLRYWKNESKTNEKFLTNNFDQSRWLLTGDLGKCDDLGYLYFDSRDDDVICSRGYRIGPGPIEQAVMKHFEVLNCAAIGCPDELSEAIKVFVVLKEGCVKEREGLSDEIREIVRENEGHYVVPKYVEFIDELPMTITGKIQRNVLKQMEIEKYEQKQKEN